MVLLAAVCAALVLGPTYTSSADFDEAVAAYERGDDATAIRELRPLAKQGHATAQINLGVMYANGQGVPQDYAEAVKWYRKAADQELASAQNNLGTMYDMGQGVPQDYAEAARWYRKAAEKGEASSQNNLGVMNANGQGVPQNYVLAHMWFSLAAANGDEKARKFRNIVAKQMSPAQIAEARKLAREWKPKK
jgi:TPR repeat protein